MRNSNLIKNAVGYFFIGCIWAVFIVLTLFLVGVFAIHADLQSPYSSFLSRRFGIEPEARQLYWRYFRPAWQGFRGYTQFDPELIYIPRPGKSRFHGPDFDVTFTFSRDTTRWQPPPADPTAPLVLVAGDSYCMGWGVQDNETYSYLLEARYGWNTVNTGVSGYGAPRELLRLRRLGLLKRCSAVVIDFAIKDPPENRAFLAGPKNFTERKNAPDLWNALKGYQQQEISFVSTLRFTCRNLYDEYKAGGCKGMWKSIWTNNDPFGKRVDYGFSGKTMATDFLAVLAQFPELKDKPIIVLEIDDYGSHSDFMPTLQKMVGANSRLIPLPIAYERVDFFRFDNHLTPTGHEHVARCVNRALAAVLAQKGATR